MKIAFVLVILSASYGIASGSFLWDLIKGVSEGIQDSFKKGDGGKIQAVKEKIEKHLDNHPKFKHHKVKLEKLLKKAGKEIDKLNKKLVGKHGPKGRKMAKEAGFNKHIEAINKWMSSLTKNDTDGEKEHGIPFLPRITLQKDETWFNRRKEKAKEIMESLRKMWGVKPEDDKEEESIPNEPLIGADYKKIIPDFVTKDFEKQRKSLGKGELKALHKTDIQGKKEKSILPIFFEDKLGEFIQKESLNEELNEFKKELKAKMKVSEPGKHKDEPLELTDKEREDKLNEELEIMKLVSTDSQDLKTTVDGLIPILGDGRKREEEKAKMEEDITRKIALLTAEEKKIDDNPINAKTSEEIKEEEEKSHSHKKEEEMMSTKKLTPAEHEVKLAEKKLTHEEEMFEEAEKLWESEIQKNAMEEIRKIEEKKHKTTEEAKEKPKEEESDNKFTALGEVIATVESEKKKEEEFRPVVYFNFDEFKDEYKAKQRELPKFEESLSLPLRVDELQSLSKRKKQPKGSAFEEMSSEMRPLFQSLDDAVPKKENLREERVEQQWLKLKKWAAANLLKHKKNKENSE